MNFKNIALKDERVIPGLDVLGKLILENSIAGKHECCLSI